jgi:hypothetical protein
VADAHPMTDPKKIAKMWPKLLLGTVAAQTANSTAHAAKKPMPYAV